jgi:hypothetical protein
LVIGLFTRAAVALSQKIGRLEPFPLSGRAAEFLTACIETGSWRIDMFVVIPECFSALG